MEAYLAFNGSIAAAILRFRENVLSDIVVSHGLH